MTASAILGKGATLQMSDSTLTAFSTVAELRTLPFPQLQGDRIDVTTHDSPGFTRQFVSGLDDIPAQTFEINWLPANATHDESTGLLALQRSKAIRVFKVTLPTAVSPTKVFTFSAQVLQFNPTVPIDNVMQVQIQLQPSGAPTIASA